MGAFLKAVIQNRHIPHMNEMYSSHPGIFFCHFHHIIFIRAAKGAGTQCYTIVGIIHQT